MLRYDPSCVLLVSGGKDTDLIVWDIVNESGKYRLKGHKGVITDCALIPEKNLLVSCSKDSFVKVWDLETQHCINTLVGHRSEVPSSIIMGVLVLFLLLCE